MSEKGARIPFGDTSQGGPHGCGGDFAFYLETFTSVWCFFAAIASILIYRVVATNTPLDTQLPSSAAAEP